MTKRRHASDLPCDLRLVAESVSDAILTIDVGSRIRYANRAAAKLFGRPVVELIGSSLTALMPERMRADHESGIRRYLASGIRGLPWHGVRLPGIHADGHEIALEISFGDFENGGEQFFTGVIRDVTEQDRIQREVEESRRGYQTLVESLPLGLVVHRGGRILYANPEVARIIGVGDPAALLGQPILRFVPPDGADTVLDRIRRVETGGGPAEVLAQQVRRVDGRLIEVETSSIPVMYDSSPAVQTVMRDLTERRHAEKSLEASEQRYLHLFESSRDSLYVTSIDGVILDVNPAFCTLFGYTREELLEMNAVELYHDPQDRLRFRSEMAADGSVQDFEVRLRRQDGTALDCLLTSSARTAAEGGIAGYQGIIRDVTERKRLEEQLAHRALHDWLTDLPNRSLLHDRLAHSLAGAHRKAGHVGLLFIDLDRFKLVNDGLGHAAGDHLLQEVGRRLSACLREEDTVARVGGDEFVVLLEALKSREDALCAAERVGEAFVAPFRFGDDEIQLSASIGLATCGLGGAARELITPEDLISQADRAMYSAKSRRSTSYCVFDPIEHGDVSRGVDERTL